MAMNGVHRSVSGDAVPGNACQIVVHLDSLPSNRNVDIKFVVGGQIFKVRFRSKAGPRYRMGRAGWLSG